MIINAELKAALISAVGGETVANLAIDLLTKLSNDRFLAESVNKIVNAFPAVELTSSEGSEDRFFGDQKWNDVRRDVLGTMVNEFASYLREMKDSSITVNNTRMVDHLWRTILQSAKSSIWTTNVNAPGSLGRSEEKLELQRKAIARGVKITRVFVFDEKKTGMGTEKELRAMKDDFSRQINAGITVLAISRSKFNRAAHTSELGDDFMIVDSNLVYVTKLAKDEDQHLEWISSKLIDHELWRDWAEDSRVCIEADATLVTLQSLPAWFG